MMFVSQMAFHAKISDPGIGGTYMTLLNTVANFGKFMVVCALYFQTHRFWCFVLQFS